MNRLELEAVLLGVLMLDKRKDSSCPLQEDKRAIAKHLLGLYKKAAELKALLSGDRDNNKNAWIAVLNGEVVIREGSFDAFKARILELESKGISRRSLNISRPAGASRIILS